MPQPYPLTIERLLNPTSNKRTIYSLWAEHSYNEKVLPKSIKKHQLPTPRTRHSLTEVASLRSAAQGGVYYQYIFFAHFWCCKDKKKNNTSQQNQKEFKTEVASLRSAAHGWRILSICFFPHFWYCKDKKKKIVLCSKLHICVISTSSAPRVGGRNQTRKAVAKPGLPSSVPPWRQSKLAKRPLLVHSKGIKKHHFSTPRTRHPFTEVASLRSAVHGWRILSIRFFHFYAAKKNII